MIFIFFIPIFLIGCAIPFLFIKIKSKKAIWIPTMVFIVATILMGIKPNIFPAAEMRDLGERVYFMMLGVATLGSVIGSLIAMIVKKSTAT
jgi:hypothetical protein